MGDEQPCGHDGRRALSGPDPQSARSPSGPDAAWERTAGRAITCASIPHSLAARDLAASPRRTPSRKASAPSARVRDVVALLLSQAVLPAFVVVGAQADQPVDSLQGPGANRLNDMHLTARGSTGSQRSRTL
jgi:hypothetical protein